MDDGTWNREGDACLPGLLKEGSVIDSWREGEGPFDDHFRVRWDDGTEGTYFQHGLTLVKTRVMVAIERDREIQALMDQIVFEGSDP
jgi:hypothetical protein